MAPIFEEMAPRRIERRAQIKVYMFASTYLSHLDGLGVGYFLSGWVISVWGQALRYSELGVGYFLSGWVTSFRGQHLGTPAVGYFRGGYFHHRLRWVTSVLGRTDIDANAYPDEDISGAVANMFVSTPIFFRNSNSNLVIRLPESDSLTTQVGIGGGLHACP
jgi:hypothetical protein